MKLRYYYKLFPTTTGLSFFITMGFIANLFGFSRNLAFWGLESLGSPWTILTHPFSFIAQPGLAFLSALFALVTLWFVGRALENRWSSLGWAAFFILTTLAVSLWSLVIDLSGIGQVVLYEPWIILGGAIMLWAWENSLSPLLAYGLFPIKGIYLAWIYVAFYFFLLLPAGLFTACTTLIPIGVAWIWLRIVPRRKKRQATRQRKIVHLKRIK